MNMPITGSAVFDRSRNGLGYIAKTKKVSGMFVISSGMKEIQFMADIIWVDSDGKPSRGGEHDDMAVNSFLDEAVARELPSVSSAQIEEWQSILLAISNEYAKERQKLKDAKKAEREQWEAEHKKLIPDWAVAAIVGEYHEDKSDSMTDYYHSETVKSVILGFSGSKKNCFKEMRRTATNCTHTAHLECAPETAEHRENWSGGHGYYLSATGRYYGWQIRKIILGSDPVSSLPMGEWCYRDTYIKLPKQQSRSAEGFSLSDGTKEGYIQISFNDKPSDETRAELKGAGFRWSPKNSVWFGKTETLPERYKE